MHAEDNRASAGRTALQVIGIAGCIIGFCAPSGGASQLAYASLVDLKSGDVVWFNVVQTGSQLPGVNFGDIRTPEGRDADGRTAARADEAGPGGSAGASSMKLRRPRAVPPVVAGFGRRGDRRARDRRRQRPDPAVHDAAADRPRLSADRRRRKGPVAAGRAGRGRDRRLQPRHQGAGRRPISARPDRQGRRACGSRHAHLPGPRPRIQRDDVPDRLLGGLFGPAAADAQRSAAGGRDRPRIRPLPSPPHDPPVARHEAQERHIRDRRDGARASAAPAPGSIPATSPSSPSSAPS